MPVATIQQLRQQATAVLTGDEARLDVDLLLAHVLGKSPVFLRTWPEHELSDEQLTQFQALLSQRQSGIPLAYILGERAFWRLNLSVSRDVLIPRPDTESVVEKVLELGQGQTWRVADLGTGSGAIALSLALEHPDWQIVATDIHDRSLAVAQHNALKHDLTNVTFACGAWFEPLTGLFHCIVSNPPYVDAQDMADLPPEYQQEPEMALAAGADGLDIVRRMLAEAADYLTEDGVLVVEVGNSEWALAQEFPQVPFDWIEFKRGGSGVFVLTAAQCQQYQQIFEESL